MMQKRGTTSFSPFFYYGAQNLSILLENGLYGPSKTIESFLDAIKLENAFFIRLKCFMLTI